MNSVAVSILPPVATDQLGTKAKLLGRPWKVKLGFKDCSGGHCILIVDSKSAAAYVQGLSLDEQDHCSFLRWVRDADQFSRDTRSHPHPLATLCPGYGADRFDYDHGYRFRDRFSHFRAQTIRSIFPGEGQKELLPRSN